MIQDRAAQAVRAVGASGREALRRFGRDQSGSYLVIGALALPMLVGFVGLGTDAGLWLHKHRSMQSAADSAAFSAAAAYISDTRTKPGLTSQAKAVTASQGFADATDRVAVTVNWPYNAAPGSVEVIVQQPQTPVFVTLISGPLTVRARAVAVGTPRQAGTSCVLSLNGSGAGTVTSQGSSAVTLTGCSLAVNSSSSSALTLGGSAKINALSVSVVGGISGGTSHLVTPPGAVTTGATATLDPYSGMSFPAVPARCDSTNFVSQTTQTINPVRAAGDPPAPVPPLYVLCGGMSLNAGAKVTLQPGIYYLVENGGNAGGLTINGGATLTGVGVTLVFSSRTGVYGSAKINGGAVINLTAPTAGPTTGLVIFGDRNMPVGQSFDFSGGSTQILNGAVYLPKAAVAFGGGSGTSNACTQLVADTVSFAGNSSFKIGCTNGMQEIGSTPASVKLIE